MEKNITIFGSFRSTPKDEEYQVAHDTAYKLSKAGYTIINGGGSGIMEASSRGAKDAEGKSTGILIKKYLGELTEEKLNTEIIVSSSLYDRLKKLIEQSVGFVIFSGGTGTLAELALTWELMNKGLIKQYPIICYDDFWRAAIEILTKEPSYIKGYSTDFIKFAYSVDEIVSEFI